VAWEANGGGRLAWRCTASGDGDSFTSGGKRRDNDGLRLGQKPNGLDRLWVRSEKKMVMTNWAKKILRAERENKGIWLEEIFSKFGSKFWIQNKWV
jgi:hypothetical protein